MWMSASQVLRLVPADSFVRTHWDLSPVSAPVGCVQRALFSTGIGDVLVRRGAHVPIPSQLSMLCSHIIRAPGPLAIPAPHTSGQAAPTHMHHLLSPPLHELCAVCLFPQLSLLHAGVACAHKCGHSSSGCRCSLGQQLLTAPGHRALLLISPLNPLMFSRGMDLSFLTSPRSVLHQPSVCSSGRSCCGRSKVLPFPLPHDIRTVLL